MGAFLECLGFTQSRRCYHPTAQGEITVGAVLIYWSIYCAPGNVLNTLQSSFMSTSQQPISQGRDWHPKRWKDLPQCTAAEQGSWDYDTWFIFRKNYSCSEAPIRPQRPPCGWRPSPAVGVRVPFSAALESLCTSVVLASKQNVESRGSSVLCCDSKWLISLNTVYFIIQKCLVCCFHDFLETWVSISLISLTKTKEPATVSN